MSAQTTMRYPLSLTEENVSALYAAAGKASQSKSGTAAERAALATFVTALADSYGDALPSTVDGETVYPVYVDSAAYEAVCRWAAGRKGRSNAERAAWVAIRTELSGAAGDATDATDRIAAERAALAETRRVAAEKAEAERPALIAAERKRREVLAAEKKCPRTGAAVQHSDGSKRAGACNDCDAIVSVGASGRLSPHRPGVSSPIALAVWNEGAEVRPIATPAAPVAAPVAEVLPLPEVDAVAQVVYAAEVKARADAVAAEVDRLTRQAAKRAAKRAQSPEDRKAERADAVKAERTRVAAGKAERTTDVKADAVAAEVARLAAQAEQRARKADAERTAPEAAAPVAEVIPVPSVLAEIEAEVKAADARRVRIASARIARETRDAQHDGSGPQWCRNEDGDRITGRSGIAPRPGTRATAPGLGKGEYGTCPLCGTGRVKLTDGGSITAHHIGQVPAADAKGRLTESQVATVDPRGGAADAEGRARAAEIGAVFGTAVVSVRNEDGERETVPATYDAISLALRQELDRRSPDNALVARLRRMRDAIVADTERAGGSFAAAHTPEGPASDSKGLGAKFGQMSAGPALVSGANIPGYAGPVTVRQVGDGTAAPETDPTNVAMPGGWVAVAGTLRKGDGGRDQFDREITDAVEIVGGQFGYLTRDQYNALSATQKRQYRRNVKTNAERAAKAEAQRKAKAAKLARAQVRAGKSVSAADPRWSATYGTQVVTTGVVRSVDAAAAAAVAEEIGRLRKIGNGQLTPVTEEDRARYRAAEDRRARAAAARGAGKGAPAAQGRGRGPLDTSAADADAVDAVNKGLGFKSDTERANKLAGYRKAEYIGN